MAHHPLDDTVVRVGALVRALQPRPALVARDAQRDAVLGAEFLELGHDAVGDGGGAAGVETVHHAGEEGELASDAVGEEVGVEQDRVGGV